MADNIQTNPITSSNPLSIYKYNNTSISNTLVHTQVEISDSPFASSFKEKY